MAELRRAEVQFVAMGCIRSQLAVRLHEATGTFWVVGENLVEYRAFTDAECTQLERARTRVFCELAREMGAFAPDLRPFHTLRFVVDAIAGRSESRLQDSDARGKRGSSKVSEANVPTSPRSGSFGAEWAGLCAAFDPADPLVRLVIFRLATRFPAVSGPGDIPGAFAALRAELAGPSGFLSTTVVGEVLAAAQRFRVAEDSLNSPARPGLAKIVGDVLRYPVSAPAALTAALVEVTVLRDKRKAERERESREEALLAAQEEFFADQLAKLGCTVSGPAGLLALLRKVRNFHYSLDWTGICRRAVQEQSQAQNQVPPALAMDANSLFREQLTDALRSFSGLREFKPYHFLISLVSEIRAAVREERASGAR